MAANELVRWDEIPGRRVEVGPMCATWTDLGKAGASVATGLKRIQIEPAGGPRRPTRTTPRRRSSTPWPETVSAGRTVRPAR